MVLLVEELVFFFRCYVKREPEVLRRYVTLVAANVSTRLKRIKGETKLEVRQVPTGSFILSLFLHHLLFDHR